MCGIIGYTGEMDTKQVLLQGLCALEYRGYDSAGIALAEENGAVHCIRSAGRVAGLIEKAKDAPRGICGIGHTRWATHGAPTEKNAHPHVSASLTLVHNGILENAAGLGKMLREQGYRFRSETDTECIAHLIDLEYRYVGTPEGAIYAAMEHMRGSYALAILFHDHPGVIYAVRQDSPLVLAHEAGQSFVASDVPAVLAYTKNILRPPQGQVFVLQCDGIFSVNRAGEKAKQQTELFTGDIAAVSRDGYESFMEKEIAQQPQVTAQLVRRHLGANGVPDFSADGIADAFFDGLDGIELVGCGSATHAALLGRVWLESLAGIPVTVSTASEYRYRAPVMYGKTLVIPISQSGETADTLAALRLAKRSGKETLAIVNAVGSAVAAEADGVLYQGAGPEIAVATTKGYTTQAVLLALLAVKLGFLRGHLNGTRTAELTGALLRDLPAAMEALLGQKEQLSQIAALLRGQRDVYFIGRGADSCAAVECSLKLKKISYIHSEAYAAGELKHGTLSLIEQGTVLIALATDPLYYAKTSANIAEVRARGGMAVLLCAPDFENAEQAADKVFRLPPLCAEFASLCAVVAMQLIACETARQRGCDVDHPRNLAKSVTVE